MRGISCLLALKTFAEACVCASGTLNISARTCFCATEALHKAVLEALEPKRRSRMLLKPCLCPRAVRNNTVRNRSKHLRCRIALCILVPVHPVSCRDMHGHTLSTHTDRTKRSLTWLRVVTRGVESGANIRLRVRNRHLKSTRK